MKQSAIVVLVVFVIIFIIEYRASRKKPSNSGTGNPMPRAGTQGGFCTYTPGVVYIGCDAGLQCTQNSICEPIK